MNRAHQIKSNKRIACKNLVTFAKRDEAKIARAHRCRDGTKIKSLRVVSHCFSIRSHGRHTGVFHLRGACDRFILFIHARTHFLFVIGLVLLACSARAKHLRHVHSGDEGDVQKSSVSLASSARYRLSRDTCARDVLQSRGKLSRQCATVFACSLMLFSNLCAKSPAHLLGCTGTKI